MAFARPALFFCPGPLLIPRSFCYNTIKYLYPRCVGRDDLGAPFPQRMEQKQRRAEVVPPYNSDNFVSTGTEAVYGPI